MFLVIGANGKIGSQVVKQLLAAGEKVRVLVRDEKKAKAAFTSGVEIAVGDVADAASLDRAFAGATSAFVLTANEAMLQEQNAYVAARKAGTKNVVLLSVAGSMRGSPLRLADMHAQSEDALKASGLTYTILRPHAFMSNILDSAGSIKGEGRTYGASKDGGVPYIDTGDIAAVAVAALRDPAKHGGQTYLLTGPQAFSQQQVADKIGALIGKSITYVDLPPAVFVDNLKKYGVPGWLADDFGKMNEWFASGAAATVSNDVEKVTGRPARTLDAWLSDNVAAFR